ncbi:MAG: hydrogenase maturation nickel metallochaperone HypA [Deltaproteobacteria bacterium]|nr:hydrogenase maturation nickel metallochaperone HypA [Deltaproteobacteria bacterium]
MHELAVAESLLKIVVEEGKKHGLSRVTQVRLRIGELSTVVPDALTFSFDVISQGTLAEGAKLIAEMTPVIAHCNTCDLDFEVEDFVFLCPQCQTMVLALVSGKELEVVDLEGE